MRWGNRYFPRKISNLTQVTGNFFSYLKQISNPMFWLKKPVPGYRVEKPVIHVIKKPLTKVTGNFFSYLKQISNPMFLLKKPVPGYRGGESSNSLR